MAKRRVSAKQRLELVAEMFDEWNRNVVTDEEFAVQMRHALTGELEPRNKEEAASE